MTCCVETPFANPPGTNWSKTQHWTSSSEASRYEGNGFLSTAYHRQPSDNPYNGNRRDDEEQDDSNSQDDINLDPDDSSRLALISKRNFSCHFHKFDYLYCTGGVEQRSTQSSPYTYTGCSRGFDFQGLKRHLYSHLPEAESSNNTGGVFTEPHDPIDQPTVSRAQMEQVEAIREAGSTEHRWYRIWDILFPDNVPPHSPYINDPETTNDVPQPRSRVPTMEEPRLLDSLAGSYTRVDSYHRESTPTRLKGYPSETEQSMSVEGSLIPTHPNQVVARVSKKGPADTRSSKAASSLLSQTQVDTITYDEIARQIYTRLVWSWVLNSTGSSPQNSYAPKQNTNGTRVTKKTSRSRKGKTNENTSTSSKKERTNGKGAARREKTTSNNDGDESDQDGFSDPGGEYDHENSPRMLLICPFYSHDPIRYSECNTSELSYRKCQTIVLEDISRLKQHLKRDHKRPDHCCCRCFFAFSNQSDLEAHLRLDSPCQLVEQCPWPEKLTPEQFNVIMQKRVGSIKEKYDFIYATLFPNETPPSSPYSSRHFQGFMDMVRRETPAVLRQWVNRQQVFLEPHQFDELVNHVTSFIPSLYASPNSFPAAQVSNLADGLSTALTQSMTSSTTESSTPTPFSDTVSHSQVHSQVGSQDMVDPSSWNWDPAMGFDMGAYVPGYNAELGWAAMQ